MFCCKRGDYLRGALKTITGSTRAARGVGIKVILTATMPGFLHDVRFAGRILRQRPGLTLAAILTLALGIGANTALFTVVNRVFFHPVPLADADRLFTLRETGGQQGQSPGVSGPVYQQLVGYTDLFEEVAAVQMSQLTLVREGSPELIWGYEVTPGFFSWLRVEPLLGRTFQADEGAQGRRDVVVLDYGFWQRQFGGDPGIVGRSIPLSNEMSVPGPGNLMTVATVIGVMPKGFQFPNWGTNKCNYWKPMDLAGHTFEKPWDRMVRNWTALVRVRVGVRQEQVEAALAALASRNAAEFPKFATQWTFQLRSLNQFFSTADLKVTMISLGAAVLVVLLLACANIANLLLARTESRHREFAIRAAVGAGRGRLIRQLLVESALLSGLGGLAGFVTAIWGLQALVARLPAGLPQFQPIVLDEWAFGFATVLAVATGLLFGLVPAWRGSRQTPAPRRALFQRALVVTQVALSLPLLFGAGLMLQSVTRFLTVRPGYDPTNLLTFMVTHPNATAEERTLKLSAMTDAFRALPGVVSVSTSTGGGSGLVGVPGSSNRVAAGSQYIGVDGFDFFQTWRIPLVRGRAFRPDDLSQGSGGVIVNETMARTLWPGEEATGKFFNVLNTPSQRYEVIGVVGDVVENPERPPEARYYAPYERSERSMFTLFTLRTASDPTAVIPDVRRALWRLDRLTFPPEMMLPEHSFDAMVLPRRTFLQLLGFFALVAVALAAVGIYGVTAHIAGVRTREMGVRLALGARPGQVRALVLRQGLRPVLFGLGAALLAAWWLTRLLESQLFGVTPHDPWTIAVGMITFLIIGTLACWIPARRASIVDPASVLRSE